MSTEKILSEVQESLKPYRPMLGDASDSIINQEVSRFPIFVVANQDIELGIKLSDQINNLEGWTIQASTLEEFVVKNLIKTDKTDDFKAIYKDPSNFLCLFIVTGPAATFAFISRK